MLVTTIYLKKQQIAMKMSLDGDFHVHIRGWHLISSAESHIRGPMFLYYSLCKVSIMELFALFMLITTI